MQVRIERLAPLRIGFLRHVGPYNQMSQTWDRLMAAAGPRGLLGPQTQFISIYHDDPEVTAPEKLRSDACITVDDRFTPSGELGEQAVQLGGAGIDDLSGWGEARRRYEGLLDIAQSCSVPVVPRHAPWSA